MGQKSIHELLILVKNELNKRNLYVTDYSGLRRVTEQLHFHNKITVTERNFILYFLEKRSHPPVNEFLDKLLNETEKMRSIHELLILVKNEFNVRNLCCNGYVYSGLCYVVYLLRTNDIITKEEYILLYRYMEFHFPVTTNKFKWPPKEMEPRNEFLDKLIKETEND